MRDFEAGEHMLKETCMVCLEKFKLGEKIILCPIQGTQKGFVNAIAIPIHTKCYYIKTEESNKD